jgi:hypothetical protein
MTTHPFAPPVAHHKKISPPIGTGPRAADCLRVRAPTPAPTHTRPRTRKPWPTRWGFSFLDGRMLERRAVVRVQMPRVSNPQVLLREPTMNDSWQNPVDEARRFKEAKRSPTVLLWTGSALLFAGVFTQQFLAIVAGLLALGAGGYWMQDITHSLRADSTK